MGRKAAQFIFYLTAGVLFLWTASLTISFVQRALPNEFWLVPVFALVVFDGGMIAWLMVFLRYADGSAQRVIAAGLCAFDFIGVGLMVLAEVMLGGQEFTEAPAALGQYAVWGIAIWTVVNVAGVLMFHITDPENMRQIRIAEEKAQVVDGAFTVLSNKRVQHSTALADQLGAQMYEELVAQLRADMDKAAERSSGKSEAAAEPVVVKAPASVNGQGPSPRPSQGR